MIHLNIAQNDLTSNEHNLSLALNASKVLQIIAADKSDAWFLSNSMILQKLVQKGMKSEDHSLHDTLYSIFDRLLRLFPLPKEDEEHHGGMSDFHAFIYQAIADGLNNL